ncbi:MAG TPA: TadE/TadG family type IV pilus assembly protein [Stellaceae bacterium]
MEFALLLPVLLTLAFGALQFGVALNNYLTLTNVTDGAARVLAISRASTSPWTTMKAQLTAVSTLTAANMTITATVNGTACSTDSGCQTALNSAQGQAASVQVSYPCDLNVFGHNYAPSCTLTAKSTELVQ